MEELVQIIVMVAIHRMKVEVSVIIYCDCCYVNKTHSSGNYSYGSTSNEGGMKEIIANNHVKYLARVTYSL